MRTVLALAVTLPLAACPSGAPLVAFDSGVQSGEVGVSDDRLVIHGPGGFQIVFLRP